VGSGCPSGGERSRCDRCPRFHQRRIADLFLRLKEGFKWRSCPCSRTDTERVARSRQSACTPRSDFCRRHTQNTEREGYAPCCAGRVSGRKTRRYVGLGEPCVVGWYQARGSSTACLICLFAAQNSDPV